MNTTVRDALEQYLESLDDSIVWESQEVDDLKVAYEVASSKLSELREKRFQVQQFLGNSARVWESVLDVPEGSVALTADHTLRVRRTEVGLETRWDFDNRWHVETDPDSIDDIYAPFTEVVE